MSIVFDKEHMQRLHFIGIGGIGMCGLAEICIARGYQVSGSDAVENKHTDRLSRLGAIIYRGHSADHLVGVDGVIYSSAINKDNPEFIYAKAQGLPMMRRGQLLAELMSFSSVVGIGVAGTHGKTTTTGLIGCLLTHAGLDPTCVNGGVLQNSDTTVRLGQGKYFVTETDESDASFLYLSPQIAIINNIEADHLETYQGDFLELKRSFIQFVEQLPKDGVVICGTDDVTIAEILPKINRRVITFGFNEKADIRATDFIVSGLQTHFNVSCFGQPWPQKVELNLPGQHNVLNALACIALAQLLDIKQDVVYSTLREFPGMARRFHAHGSLQMEGAQAVLFEDYGHHPTEIKATIDAARMAFPNRRLVWAFQPHRYSRTQALMTDFAHVLQEVDVLLLLDVYSAGEKPIVGVNGHSLFTTILQTSADKDNGDDKENKIFKFIPDLQELPNVMAQVLKDGDVVFLQGAGNINSMVKTLLGS